VVQNVQFMWIGVLSSAGMLTATYFLRIAHHEADHPFVVKGEQFGIEQQLNSIEHVLGGAEIFVLKLAIPDIARRLKNNNMPASG
jgi:hypothetical protein